MVQTGVKMKKARPNRIAVISAWHVCLQKPTPWQMQKKSAVRLFVEKILKTIEGVQFLMEIRFLVVNSGCD
jgi:hypothetical protein